MIFLICNDTERLDQDISGIVATTCDHCFQCSCVSKWVNSSCPVIFVSLLFGIFIVNFTEGLVIRKKKEKKKKEKHFFSYWAIFCFFLLGVSPLSEPLSKTNMLNLWDKWKSLDLFNLWVCWVWKVCWIFIRSKLSANWLDKTWSTICYELYHVHHRVTLRLIIYYLKNSFEIIPFVVVCKYP